MQTNNKQQTIQNNPNNANNKQTQNKILSERTIKAKVNQKQRKNKPKLNNNNEKQQQQKQQQQKESTKISRHTRGQSVTTYALTQIHTHRHNTNVVRK